MSKGALYEVLRAEADHCADLLRQGKGPVLAYPDGMQLATLLGKAADEIERLREAGRKMCWALEKEFGPVEETIDNDDIDVAWKALKEALRE
jgi:hypothetical protein